MVCFLIGLCSHFFNLIICTNNRIYNRHNIKCIQRFAFLLYPKGLYGNKGLMWCNLRLFFLCFLLIYYMNGQQVNLHSVTGLTSENGLSQNNVQSIFQDEKGFMWFATHLGLNRYDGNKLIHYDESFGLKRTSYKVITKGDSSILWLGSEGSGLIRFNTRTEQVRYIPLYKDSLTHSAYSVSSILKDRTGNLWVGTYENGLFRLKNDTLVQERLEATLPTDAIYAIVQDHEGHIWVGTASKGLFCIDNSLTHYKHYGRNEGIHSENIRSIYQSKNQTLFVGTMAGLSIRTKTERTFRSSFNKEALAIISIAESPNGNIWLGTFGDGLYEYSFSDNRVKKNHDISSQLPDQTITSLHFTSPHIFWVGTFYKGVYKVLFSTNEFKHIDLNGANVASLFMDQNTNLYIGTLKNGLFIKSARGELRHYPYQPENPNSIRGQSIFSIYKDHNSQTWIGTFDSGLTRFTHSINHAAATHFVQNDSTKNWVSENTITQIYQDRSKKLWIGTFGGGLNVYDSLSGRFHEVSPKDKKLILALQEAEDGSLWVGTAKGLFRLKNGSYTNYPLRTTSKIYSLFRSKSGTLWVSTSDRYLYQYNKNRDQFIYEPTTQNIAIHGILEDDDEHLWLSSEDGLFSFNPKTKMLKKYSSFNGVTNQFNINAQASNKDTLYFGGLNGITYFNPKVLRSAQKNTIEITDIKLFNKSIRANESAFSKSVTELSEITIPYAQKMLSIHFSDLNYSTSHLTHYVYQLEGFQSKWYETTNKTPFVTYTNLNPGEYMFRIKHSGTHKQKILKIIVEPPFWMTEVFYVSAISALVLLLVFFYKRRIRLIHARNRELEQLVKERTKELEVQKDIAIQAKNRVVQLDEMKTKFYENISHEFRTPLTLIIDPAKKLLKQHAFHQPSVQLILDNGKRLLNLINELLALSKTQTGEIQLQGKTQNITQFLNPIVTEFRQLAEIQQLRFEYENMLKEPLLFFDDARLEKALLNLLSNAFKFTPAHGKVTLSVEDEAPSDRFQNGAIKLCVTDTGIGIQKDELTSIFTRFYQAKHSQTLSVEGTGIGLALTKELIELHGGKINVESCPNVETRFSVLLPKNAPEEPIKSVDLPKKVHAKKSDRETILIVEDHAEIRAYLASQLSEEFNIREAIHGGDGIASAKETLPDLIISDIMMPEINGYELCNTLKSLEITQHIPIILLTAKSEEEDQIEGLKYQADDYITKPFNSDILIQRVRNLLDQRKKLREHFKMLFFSSVKETKQLSADEHFIKKIKTFIEEHIEDPGLSVSVVANEFAVSQKQLERKIKAITNLTPTNFIRFIRLKHAEHLLKNKTGTVSEIAYKVGFNNLSYFSKMFKEEFGISPSDVGK